MFAPIFVWHISTNAEVERGIFSADAGSTNNIRLDMAVRQSIRRIDRQSQAEHSRGEHLPSFLDMHVENLVRSC